MPHITSIWFRPEEPIPLSSGYIIEPTFRMQVIFSDGRILSVIQGPHTYGGDQGLYECGYVLSEEVGLAAHPVWGDSVNGHLDEDEVVSELRWIRDDE